MVAANVTIRTTGPFFAAGMPARVQRAIEGGVREIVETGDEKLNEVLRPRPAGVFHSGAYAAAHGYRQTGHYRRGIHTVLRGLLGRIDDSNSVYGPWLEGVGSRNATTRFKGYHSFRRVANELQQEAPRIMRRHMAALVRRLS